jgi:hypothetical protein
MKKNLFLLLVSIVLVECSSGIKEQKFMGISGNPKSVKETKYEAIEKFGEVIEKDIEGVQYYEFDKDGYVQKTTIYDFDGDVVFTTTNKFEDGKCVENNSFQRYNSISTTNILKNRTSKNESWESKTSDGRTTTSNIELGNQKTISTIKDSDGNTISKIEQHFDNNGNLVEHKVYGENQVAYWVKSTFDDDSKEITKTMLVDGNDEIYTYTYKEVDKRGNWTKRIEHLNGEFESITIREIMY